MALQPRARRSADGLREEPEEAGDAVAVALDLDVAGSERIVELTAFPDQGAQRPDVGLDDRVGVGGPAAAELDRLVRDPDVERVLAEPELVAGADALRGPGVEERAERED